MEEAKCEKCGSSNISWSLCNDCGHEHLHYPNHRQGKALDIEIEQQDVAQSDVWKHDDFRDNELERINKLMDIHTNSIHFYNNYAGRSDLLKDYVELTYQKVILAIDNFVNK